MIACLSVKTPSAALGTPGQALPQYQRAYKKAKTEAPEAMIAGPWGKRAAGDSLTIIACYIFVQGHGAHMSNLHDCCLSIAAAAAGTSNLKT